MRQLNAVQEKAGILGAMAAGQPGLGHLAGPGGGRAGPGETGAIKAIPAAKNKKERLQNKRISVKLSVLPRRFAAYTGPRGEAP